MKRYYLFFIFLFLLYQGCTQNQLDTKDIVGIWQAKTFEIGSGYLDNYQFFENGDFIFNISEYNELKRIVSIKGKYRIKADTIFYKVESTLEITGGNLIRSNLTTVNDSWSLSGEYVEKEIKYISEAEETALIKKGEPKGEFDCILIDEIEFYRIEKDPNNY